MGEGVGQGVGVGEEGDFGVFGCLAGEKRGGRVFSIFFDFFGGRPCGWAGFCVGVCEKGGCPPDWRGVLR